MPMTNEAAKFMAEALKRVKLDDNFIPAEIGKRIGLNRIQSEEAARSLSNAGVLELGFDNAANFTPEFQKMTAENENAAAATARR